MLDKLAGYCGNPVRAQAIVQISELMDTSREAGGNSENSHQWMDPNGWIFRKVFLETKTGEIYEATFNIADGRDRKILYEVNGVHQIEKKNLCEHTIN